MTHPVASEHRELHRQGAIEGGRLHPTLVPVPAGTCHAVARDGATTFCGVPTEALQLFRELHFEAIRVELQCDDCRSDVDRVAAQTVN
ncbi:MAG: hypothetical protein ACRDP1_02000 [Nocardioidaceae bacterium]